MQPLRIVILGGGYSGMMTARRLAGKRRGQSAQITLINVLPDFVQRIRLHQLAAQQPLPRIPLRGLLESSGVRFVQARVTRIDPQARQLTLQTPAGTQSTMEYDRLVYALGSHVETTRVPGVAQFASTLTSESSAAELRDKLAAVRQGGRLVICGGGLSGIESASELAEANPNLNITLITRDRFGAQLSEVGRQYLRQTFDRRHIEVLDNTTVQQITAHEIRFEGGAVPYDVCLWAAAFAVPDLARASGFAVNPIGQIIVDDHLRSVSHPDVYAVGDAADVSAAVAIPIRMACATAMPMGAYVADELAASSDSIDQRPYAFAYALRCISLGRHAALVQLVDADDTPKERIITGRWGAVIKEIICRYTLWQIDHPRLLYIPRPPDSRSTGKIGTTTPQIG